MNSVIVKNSMDNIEMRYYSDENRKRWAWAYKSLQFTNAFYFSRIQPFRHTSHSSKVHYLHQKFIWLIYSQKVFVIMSFKGQVRGLAIWLILGVITLNKGARVLNLIKLWFFKAKISLQRKTPAMVALLLTMLTELGWHSIKIQQVWIIRWIFLHVSWTWLMTSKRFVKMN
jgi:hypothetical protein